MAIAAGDLVAYAAASMPDDESSTVGGAIDPDYQVVFTQLAANDDVEAVSSAAGDTTQNVTVEGRNAAGSVVSETKQLNGTTPVIFSTMGIIERVLKITMDADAVGVVTIQRSPGGAAIYATPIGERGVYCLFRKSYSEASPKNYHEKFFWKNKHATLALQVVVVSEDADPTTKVSYAMEDAVDDTGTATNRLTAPAGASIGASGFVTSGDLTMSTETDASTADLAAGSAIGMWAKLVLDADEPPIRSTWTSKIAGQTA